MEFMRGCKDKAFDLANSNNGTLTGSPPWGPKGPNSPGTVLDFDGSTQYVDIGAPAILEFGATAQFSIAALIKSPADVGAAAFVVGKDFSTGARGFGFGESITGQLYTECGGFPGFTNTGPVFGNRNTWTLIGISQSGDANQTFSGFVDGFLIGTVGNSGFPYAPNSLAHYYFGGRSYSGFFNGYTGQIGAVYTWSRKLRTTEWKELANAPFSVILAARRRRWNGAAVAAGGDILMPQACM